MEEGEVCRQMRLPWYPMDLSILSYMDHLSTTQLGVEHDAFGQAEVWLNSLAQQATTM
jgi:hypothetical protein